MAHEDLAVFYESLRLGDDNDQFDTEDLPPQQGQQPLAAGEAPAAGEALQEDAQLMADLDLLLDDAAADPLGAVLGCGCGSCGDGCGSYGNGSGGPSPSCGCGGSGCEASGIAGLCGNHSPPDSSTAAPAVPAAAAAAQPAIQADARAGGQAPATRRQLQWVPKHIEAVLWTAAVFVQLAGQFAGAAVLAAAAWAVKKKQIKPRKVSAREAKYGFSWLTDQVGVVTGWTGAVTVVRLPGDCYAVVPVFCPCCGKVHHSEADWAKYLSIEGNYRVDNPDGEMSWG
ncbi:FKBP-type peptidyl-prolyl cis-trans isomerase [Chlorella sorokiniana]|uniref:FKBP-type peptidyl-prolyl cis-trans isomerase n=1 Tax=Chlorella sorokiniana TaxID=3076 RepID=A0A2P6TRA1_CHLSO|nr:FKBP-type peptidyl-prolyl cis-trans isomerase [Chlorella sorokiniana]|eukprot:PRW56592.1 FKBP-type peptidyl-prolyl cis-trans isomerase [Chlorella sorokiniana]